MFIVLFVKRIFTLQKDLHVTDLCVLVNNIIRGKVRVGSNMYQYEKSSVVPV